jgi:hypothetical protein
MKEIDFLPQWYQDGRRRESSVKRQYVALAAMFLVMVVWNALAVRSISLANAELNRAEPQSREAAQVCYQFDRLVHQVADCQKELRRMQALEGRLNVAEVLAELSTLIDGPLALESLEVKAERASEPSGSGANGLVDAATQFPIVMKGLAQDAPAVAAVLRRVEGSPCFQQVNLAISRNPGPVDRARTDGLGHGDRPAVAFEIRCLLRVDESSGQ